MHINRHFRRITEQLELWQKRMNPCLCELSAYHSQMIRISRNPAIPIIPNKFSTYNSLFLSHFVLVGFEFLYPEAMERHDGGGLLRISLVFLPRARAEVPARDAHDRSEGLLRSHRDVLRVLFSVCLQLVIVINQLRLLLI